MPTKEEKLWGAASHLSYLLGLPIVLPLLLYMWKRDQSTFVAAQAKQAVGLHIATIIAVALTFGLSFATFGLGAVILVPALIAFSVTAFILSVVAVLKISNGESYHYPVFGDWVDGL